MYCIRLFFASGVLTMFLPGQSVSMSLVYLQTFILSLAAFKIRIETNRQETHEHYSMVQNFMENSIFILHIFKRMF